MQHPAIPHTRVMWPTSALSFMSPCLFVQALAHTLEMMQQNRLESAKNVVFRQMALMHG